MQPSSLSFGRLKKLSLALLETNLNDDFDQFLVGLDNRGRLIEAISKTSESFDLEQVRELEKINQLLEDKINKFQKELALEEHNLVKGKNLINRYHSKRTKP